MPEELHAALKSAAEERGNSLNSEIVDRLESSLVQESGISTSQGRSMRIGSMRPVRIAIAAAFIVAAALLVGVFATSKTASHNTRVLAKKDPDSSLRAKAGISNEGPRGTLEAQQEAERAYPAAAVPAVATQNSQATYATLKTHGKGPGAWQSIGPSQATYPAVLDQFLAGGKQYIASGRVTALAIGGCKKDNSKCSLYLGAAGGGVWVADKATDGNGNVHWQFKSGSFGTNAIGSLLVDPSDRTGNTVYAGTGELNASGDSEAGKGIYKSTDGGDNWTLVPGSDLFANRAVGTMAFDGAGNLLVGIGSAVRGVTSVSGGSTSCPSVAICAQRGLYRQTGSTFTLLRPTDIRGVTQVAVDPNNSNILYQASYGEGVQRSLDNGVTWTQIKVGLVPGYTVDRSAFAVNKLPGGKTRMYVGIGNDQTVTARFFRTDDAAGAAVFTDLTTTQNADYCTAQCWYDNYVVSPVENPDVVYLGGSFDYNTINGATNGRAVLMSTDAGAHWSDITRDQGNDGWLHPDEHALVTVPGHPLQWIAGNDGGV
ncbi:MAG: Arc family DNA-binding protein, partial [Actinobacteria bacterium]|nr:Arc family DNA-binding protein [Actinomycetota bacterium]